MHDSYVAYYIGLPIIDKDDAKIKKRTFEGAIVVR